MAIVSIIIFGLILDQTTKFLALRNLAVNESIPVLKGIFHLTLVFNRGAAFGIFKNYTTFLIIASCATILFIVLSLKESRKVNLVNISLSLILSGAIGNLIDRLRLGLVVDFLDFRVWPVFNVADSIITIGALLLAFSLFRPGNATH
ncbi:MAG: signal peptidase II, partial [Candidatus Omnitrophica bacterium]|nr:signal peptidase II [Candidatus Omnitrophota bacterium]